MSILFDLRTSQVWSDDKGWNYTDASIKRHWTEVIGTHMSQLSLDRDNWVNRILICAPIPYEPEQWT